MMTTLLRHPRRGVRCGSRRRSEPISTKPDHRYPGGSELDRPLDKFICDRVIPGCTHEDRDESREQLLERAEAHLKEHHDLDHDDEPIDEVLKRTGIIFIRPA